MLGPVPGLVPTLIPQPIPHYKGPPLVTKEARPVASTTSHMALGTTLCL